MNVFYKKIIILFIIGLVSYLLYRLMKNRKEIISPNYEPFTPNTIQLQNTYPTTLKLSNYCIKASLNSAYNNYTIDCDPTKANNRLGIVLNRGVRFLDFEIYSLGGNPIIGYSTNYDPTNTNNEATNNAKDTFIQLNNVFQFISLNKPKSITDPLFIQLRFKTQLTNIYEKVVSYIQQIFGGALYSGKITGNTVLSEITNKIIIVVDYQHSNSSYQNSSLQNSNLVNLEIGNPSLKNIITYTTSNLIKTDRKRININNDGVTITSNENPPVWTLAYPNVLDTANPDVKTIMINQCPNIIQCRYDFDDANLALYESLFTNQGFVPLGSAYSIATKW